jgi:hypothetical protein
MWKVVFHLNEDIERHCMKLELDFNWIGIQFDMKLHSIQFKFCSTRLNWIELNWMKYKQRCWKFACEHDVQEKENMKNAQFEKTPFHASLLGNKLNRLQFGTIQVTTYDL